MFLKIIRNDADIKNPPINQVPKKTQFNLSNKSGIRLVDTIKTTTRRRFCNHECDYALSRRVFIDGDETKLKPMILKDIAV
jgi:hypothetical protein